MSKKSLNKLPSQISTEDLIDSLTENNQPETVIEQNEVVNFLTYFGLESGAFPVETQLIYKLYSQWSKDPVSRDVFGHQTNRYLFQRQIGRYFYYLINKSSFKLGEKSFKLMKKRHRSLTKSPTYQKHFESFLNQHDIKEGSTWIPFYAIHYLYNNWCHNTKKGRPMGYKTLFNFCNLYFKSKRLGSSKAKVFAVSKNVYDHVTKDQIKEIEEGRAKKLGPEKTRITE